MARNQPFDFSDDDDIGIGHGSSSRHTSMSGSSDMIGSADLADADLLDDSTAHSGHTGSKSAKQAAQTHTATRSTTAQQQDTPTSMQHKRGNQPR
jgi:hypothetical protein